MFFEYRLLYFMRKILLDKKECRELYFFLLYPFVLLERKVRSCRAQMRVTCKQKRKEKLCKNRRINIKLNNFIFSQICPY